MKGWYRTAAAFALSATVISANCCMARAQSEPLELAIKATYLYKFTSFVDWPADTFTSPTAPIALCVVGNDAMSELLMRAVQGQKSDSHSFAVRRTDAASSAGCNIMFVAGSSAEAIRQSLAAVHGKPVLTVTDEAPEGAKGIINFLVADNRVRFEIDNEAASQNKLVISSKLLSLAVRVQPKS